MITYHFYVIGCGGTGSLLARDLPKLLTGTLHSITVVDGDVVEKKNIIRQGYQEQDITDNKANVLSKKINALYGVKTYAIDKYITKDELLVRFSGDPRTVPVIIGCVDNDATRKILEYTFNKCRKSIVYIDSANGEYEGNIYVARKSNNVITGTLRSSTYELKEDLHPTDESCEVQTAKGNIQYLVTNAKMAVGVLEHCNSLLEGKLKEGVQVVKRFETVFF